MTDDVALKHTMKAASFKDFLLKVTYLQVVGSSDFSLEV